MKNASLSATAAAPACAPSAVLELNDPLLNDWESCALLGVARPTFHKWVARGLVPKPIKLGHLSRWPRSEIIAVIENAKAARDAA